MIVIVKQMCIISELWTMDWKVLILSSTHFVQIYIYIYIYIYMCVCIAYSEHFYIADRCTGLDVNHFYMFLTLGYLCANVRILSH